MDFSKILLMVTVPALLLASCAKENADGESASMEFSVKTKGAGISVPDNTNQLVRLYVGVNGKEHAGVDDKQEHIHLHTTADLTDGYSFLVTGLTERRYKMAFICVPKIDGMLTMDASKLQCDYNAVIVDFSPILDKQPSANMEDIGHIYRKVISRHASSGKQAMENVILDRINGQLVIDMGILEDQFENKVEKIEVIFNNLPTSIYLRDNDNAEIITARQNPNKVYTSIPDLSPAAKKLHHRIILNLLPSNLNGVIRVTEQGKAAKDYKIGGTYGGGKVSVKPNTRTILEFNGLHRDYFTVKYAGFDGSSIGVDDDQWDGWENIQ